MIATAGKQQNQSDAREMPFDQALEFSGIPIRHRPFFHLWVRQYRDFCATTGFPESSPTTVPLFLSHLEDKVPEPWRREQAEKAVRMYLDACPQEHNQPVSFSKSAASIAADPWDTVIASLENAIRLKRLSHSMFKNYSGWARRFWKFIGHRDPASLRSSDARLFLEHLAIKSRISAKT